MTLSMVFARSSLFSSLLISMGVVAGQPPVEPLEGGFPSPPDDAMQVCLNKPADTPCTFGRGDRADSGLCQYTDDKKYFACNPHAGEKRPPRPEDEEDTQPRLDDDMSEILKKDDQDVSNLQNKEQGVRRFPSHLIPTTSS